MKVAYLINNNYRYKIKKMENIMYINIFNINIIIIII